MMRTRDGFTLIELIIVIAIIGILAAVAVPRFFDLTSSAKKAATQGGLGALRSGVVLAHSCWLANGGTGGGPCAAVTYNAVGYPTLASMNAGDVLEDRRVPADELCTNAANKRTMIATTGTPTSDATCATGGWYYNDTNGSVFSVADVTL